ncbi:hypothetical protein [Streptomyces sp. NPDC020330]|uniref:hypothetical protein n=1 Tax=unclassified Streptomyces TaxID=2593676 RepID=UPI0037930D50
MTDVPVESCGRVAALLTRSPAAPVSSATVLRLLLRLTKRIMRRTPGRAGFDLLRPRVFRRDSTTPPPTAVRSSPFDGTT